MALFDGSQSSTRSQMDMDYSSSSIISIFRYGVIHPRDGTLIIECRKCILRRWKKIPLSSIQSVEPISESIGGVYYRADRPERLRITYSHRRHYRFGLCMTDTDREALAKKIMDLRKVKT